MLLDVPWITAKVIAPTLLNMLILLLKNEISLEVIPSKTGWMPNGTCLPLEGYKNCVMSRLVKGVGLQ